MACAPSLVLDGSGTSFDMSVEGPMSAAPSFTLSQSGTFAKEDFVINKSGIAAVNGTPVWTPPDIKLADLEMVEVLGKGASSVVRKAIHRPTGTPLAVKILNVFDKARRDQLVRELRTLYSSTFPWLVTFYGCLYDEGAMHILLEHMDGGSLADLLTTAQRTGSGPLSEIVLAKICMRVLAGLQYLHRERHQARRPTCARIGSLTATRCSQSKRHPSRNAARMQRERGRERGTA